MAGQDIQISFERLYDDDKTVALSLFLVWVNDFLQGLDVDHVAIDLEVAHSFVSNLRKSDFPANGGFDSASPFKKAANIYVWLHVLNPFKSPLPEETVGKNLSKYSHNTCSLIGYNLIKCCLHQAILRKNGQNVVLTDEIKISKHFFTDLVEASDGITPVNHFKIFSLLFESLTYQENSVSYEKVL
jgi:hypothetical protein